MSLTPEFGFWTLDVHLRANVCFGRGVVRAAMARAVRPRGDRARERRPSLRRLQAAATVATSTAKHDWCT